jgi:hypothetical protein
MAANPKLSEEDKKARRLQDMEARRAMFQAVRPSTDTALEQHIRSERMPLSPDEVLGVAADSTEPERQEAPRFAQANPKLSEEDKKARRLRDMEARRTMVQAVRPATDSALEQHIRSERMPLSPDDLPGAGATSDQSDVTAFDVETEPGHQETPSFAPADSLEAAGKGRRFVSATVASPTSAVLFRELGSQVKAFSPPTPARRITVAVSEDVFSRVSHFSFVERLGKIEILTFLLDRFVPKEGSDKAPRWLVRNPGEATGIRRLTYFEDAKLNARLLLLKDWHGLSKVTVIENIVVQALPASPRNVPPAKRKRAGLVQI